MGLSKEPHHPYPQEFGGTKLKEEVALEVWGYPLRHQVRPVLLALG